jgi:hypothetical protein
MDTLKDWLVWSAVLTGLAVQIPVAIAVAWWLLECTIDSILKWSGALNRFLAYCWTYKEFHVWLAQVPDLELVKDLYCNANVNSTVWRERDELLEMTRLLPSHPEGYEGVCECQRCIEAKCYDAAALYGDLS